MNNKSVITVAIIVAITIIAVTAIIRGTRDRYEMVTSNLSRGTSTVPITYRIDKRTGRVWKFSLFGEPEEVKIDPDQL